MLMSPLRAREAPPSLCRLVGRYTTLCLAGGQRGPLRRRRTLETRSLLALYRTMTEIREFELRVSRLTRDGKIPGFVHLSLGQEASAVGACAPLTQADVITSTHRGPGHCLAQ